MSRKTSPVWQSGLIYLNHETESDSTGQETYDVLTVIMILADDIRVEGLVATLHHLSLGTESPSDWLRSKEGESCMLMEDWWGGGLAGWPYLLLPFSFSVLQRSYWRGGALLPWASTLYAPCKDRPCPCYKISQDINKKKSWKQCQIIKIFSSNPLNGWMIQNFISFK